MPAPTTKCRSFSRRTTGATRSGRIRYGRHFLATEVVKVVPSARAHARGGRPAEGRVSPLSVSSHFGRNIANVATLRAPARRIRHVPADKRREWRVVECVGVLPLWAEDRRGCWFGGGRGRPPARKNQKKGGVGAQKGQPRR